LRRASDHGLNQLSNVRSELPAFVAMPNPNAVNCGAIDPFMIYGPSFSAQQDVDSIAFRCERVMVTVPARLTAFVAA